MAKFPFFISNHWRSPKVIITLFILEFLVSIPVLALFAIANPDTYRKRLRTDGNMNGFNSSPLTQLYAYANYKPVPAPLCWSQLSTTLPFVLSIMSTFFLIVKAVMFILHCWWPFLSFIIHGGLAAAWSWSIYIQTSSDLSEPSKPQHGPPWFITKSCSVAYYEEDVHYCQQAKTAFCLMVVFMSLFAINAAWALWSLIPTKEQRLARRMKVTELQELEEAERQVAAEAKQWELQDWPKTPGTTGGMKSPLSPRSQAFNQLGGPQQGRTDLPLRYNR